MLSGFYRKHARVLECTHFASEIQIRPEIPEMAGLKKLFTFVQHRTRQDRGFTVVELIIGIAILAILASMAVPRVADYINRNRFNGATLQVLADLRLARMTAVERNRPVVFAVNTPAGTYEAFVNDGAGSADADLNGLPDNAENWTRDANERLIAAGRLPRGVTFTAANFNGNPEFVFDNRGFPFDRANNLTGGTITLAGGAGLNRQVVMIPSGHAVIQ
jgi:prepilin-type N-terminal cleavage/methylation domain-containing protein